MDEREENERGESRRALLLDRAERANIPMKTILATIFSVVVVYFAGLTLYRLRSLVLLLLVGGFVALVLNPAVDRLQRGPFKRRGVAVLIVAVATFISFGLLAFAFGYPLVNAFTHLANTLPRELTRAEHGQGWVGHAIARYHVAHWVETNASKLISLANGLSKPALALGKGAVSMLLLLVTMFAFVILLLIEAPKIRHFLLTTMEPARAARAQEISRKISQAALGYVRGNLIMSFIAGVVVFITLLLLHVPFAFLFALWVFLVDFLPQIGGALAGLPTVLFAFVHSTPAGVVTLIVFVVYTLVQNHVLNPLVMSKAMNLNPLVVFLAILIGAELGDWVAGSFGGLVGVLLAIPLAAALEVIVSEWWHATHPEPPTDN
jgi:predicted PurR-regulated permease PerM